MKIVANFLSAKTAFLLMIVVITTNVVAQTSVLTESETDCQTDFKNNLKGKLPDGFKGSNNCGQGVTWVVVGDNGNKVIMQLEKNGASCFNLLLLKNFAYKNFIASVKVKAVAGLEDQGGGFVWRCQNDSNYYVARYNPLEKNLKLYKVVNGERKQLKSAKKKIATGEWFTMTITMNGNKITCSLNGHKLIKTKDDTFVNVGKVGLWTKSDAQTCFDDIDVQRVKNE